MSAARNDALDGVRGCAVTAVLMYHAHYSWARGGFLGVDMFFVLSGYLITSGLLQLLLNSGHRFIGDYGYFISRRVARLAPALLAALGCAFVLTAAAGTSQDRARLLPCSAVAGGYAMNLPAAERLHCAAIWHVTWSLASEEQFYLVWPLLLAVLIAAAGGAGAQRARTAIATAALGLLAVALGWQLWLRQGGASTSRVLFAPDGRSLLLLLGCALAAANLEQLTSLTRRGAGLAGAVVLAGMLGCASASPGYATLACVLATAAGTAAVVVAVTGPERNAVSRALGSRVPAAAGRLSYSLYVFHELAFRVSDLLAERGTVAYELIRWPLCLTAAICSYRLVEGPCRRRINRLLDDRLRPTRTKADSWRTPRVPSQPSQPSQPAQR